jgi:hypothetical protein
VCVALTWQLATAVPRFAASPAVDSLRGDGSAAPSPRELEDVVDRLARRMQQTGADHDPVEQFTRWTGSGPETSGMEAPNWTVPLCWLPSSVTTMYISYGSQG